MFKFNYRTLPVQAQAVLLVGAISIAFLIMQMLLLAVAVSTYNINCLISGNCRNWATLLAVAYVVTQGSALLSLA